ncbi:hypothetical protein [Burkholderia multivorans]|uniref:hypothetical protein n=1 Tax=Burkholderia multivorans TaxID=87883 RepID=UPI0021C13D28|nr:hypothetical protein [Burkholderia multivorans]
MGQSYFFWSPTDQMPGHVFEPGNHGRVMRTYRHLTADATNGWKLAIEYLMERVRSMYAPDKPSRLLCAYAFLSESDAMSRRVSDASSKLYEVELVAPDLPSHIADFDLYNVICKSDPSQPFIPKTEMLARQYWDGQINGVRELLTLSAMRIVKRVA